MVWFLNIFGEKFRYMRLLTFFLPLLQAQPADSLPDFDIKGIFDYLTHTPAKALLSDTGHWFADLAVKLALCLIVFWLAKKGINFISNLLRTWMDRRRADRTVSHFLINLMRVILWLVVLWVLVSILDVDTASIVALFASAGLAFGLALSGTLQNFAGGIMILLFKPFRTGDYIFSQGEEGTVQEITIINTILTTPDNRTVYLPNGATFTGIVRNTSQQPTRRIEWMFSIGYANDYDHAKDLLLKLIAADSRILKDPAPFIALNKLSPTGVEIVARVWVKSADYWGVFYDLNEAVYKTFPINELSMPSPQMDVYLYPPKAADDTPGTPVSPPKTTAKTEFVYSPHHCDASAKPSGGEGGK